MNRHPARLLRIAALVGALGAWAVNPGRSAAPSASASASAELRVVLDGREPGKRFDGIGVVNGGGATSVLLKDYPEPQRSQILDLVYRPKFGASVSTLYVEIPGDGNSTQGSMPSHMHTREDLDYHRGYTWWILREASRRNPRLTLDGTAWSAPAWIGHGEFWSQDAADYYVSWLRGLRQVHGLELEAIGCRNEKGVSLEFARTLRATLDANGFNQVALHAFDNWGENKLDFVPALLADPKLQEAIAIIGAHTFTEIPASAENQAAAAQMNKRIWNTEEHVYRKGFDCAISIVRAFNENFIRSGATKIVNWYDIAGVYPVEPYSHDPAAVVANAPWSGHYFVREALWGYAHYGQFTEVGWEYLPRGCGELAGGGSFVTLKAPTGDYSIIVETKGAKTAQQIRFDVQGGLATGDLCAWSSTAEQQFVEQPVVRPEAGVFTVTVEPESIYSFSTTRGQRKGSFADVPAAQRFPFPYLETFESYASPVEWGRLPRYTADISGAFELAERPDHAGRCMRQAVPARPLAWAPEWLPYTILGDEQWTDYEVGVDVWLNAADTAGVMGRINHVGTGYGTIPKGYFLQLRADGRCSLVVVRGAPDKTKLEGDAEQQALRKALRDDSEGGEKVLATATVASVRPGRWHRLTLRFEGSTLTGLVDGQPVLKATDPLYSRGMAGLLAGGDEKNYSTPYFDNLAITAPGAPTPVPTPILPGQRPIYPLPMRAAP